MFERIRDRNIPVYSNAAQPQLINLFPSFLCQNARFSVSTAIMGPTARLKKLTLQLIKKIKNLDKNEGWF